MKKLFIFIGLTISLFGQKIYKADDSNIAYDIFYNIVYDKKSAKPIIALLKDYYGNGNLRSEIPYKDGKREGIEKWYYENGNLTFEALYKNDILDGVHKSYYKNGKLVSQTTLKNGLPHGIVKNYYKSGKLKSEVPYKNGIVHGILKEYYKKGKLKASINFKNGYAIAGFKFSFEGDKTRLTEADFNKAK